MRIWKIAAIAGLALTSFAADNVAPTKSELEEMYNKAFRAFDGNNFPEALKELDAIDARQPDLAADSPLASQSGEPGQRSAQLLVCDSRG